MSSEPEIPEVESVLIRMDVSKIRIDERRGEQVVVLKERGGTRLLPIIIGISEVTAIKMKVSGVQPPRPLTHDLLKSVIATLGGKLERVIITKLELNTFYAALAIQDSAGKIERVDARPSDSIALALRADAPIYVAEEVLNQVASSYGL
jgi:uncharacterized protein